jgi:thiamine-monophosphate kinase
MRDEDSLIRRIARAVSPKAGRDRRYGLSLGIGDDAAILVSRSHQQWVISCDAFIEGVHFLANVHPPDSVGYKALVRATSDLVAMGARPRLFLLTLAIPEPRTGRWLDEFLGGMRRAARYLDMQLAGGDTTMSRSVAMNVTVLGEIGSAGERALTRSGGRAGDRIYVSGILGRAQIGLELIRDIKRRNAVRKVAEPLHGALQAHLYPRIRVELGRWLAHHRVASAMMDLSDGLSSDLARLCHASGVGAKLFADRIPATSPSDALRKLLPRGFDALEAALHGGDDYELLLTVPPKNEAQLRRAPDFCALTCIGELTRDRRILLVGADGKRTALNPAGWDPFRKSAG